jgi:hypothetical protein
MGKQDPYGNYVLELNEHHVHIEEKGFFTRIFTDGPDRIRKDNKVEAFSKFSC